jgi:predicted Fe-S protein YdhL (DUF1289 family)
MSADLEADSAAAGPQAPAGSPCNSVCRMDAQGVYCIGCFRTLDEIAGWAGFDDARRRLIWAQLSERRMQAAQAAWMPRR